jgi:hypothetical protein
LFESCLDLNDWRRAEQLFPTASKRLSSQELPEWYARIAVAAARSGAKPEALRIWKSVANLNPAELRALDTLAKTGLGPELIGFYRQMQKKMPTSTIPARAIRILEGR